MTSAEIPLYRRGETTSNFRNSVINYVPHGFNTEELLYEAYGLTIVLIRED